MIAEDFRPVRVLATESLAGPRREHVRAQGEKTARARPAFCRRAIASKTGHNFPNIKDLRSSHKRLVQYAG